MYSALGVTTVLYVLIALGVFGTLTVPEVIGYGETAIAEAARPTLGDAGLHDDGDRGPARDLVVRECDPLRLRRPDEDARGRRPVPAVLRAGSRLGAHAGMLITAGIVLVVSNLVDLSAIASVGSACSLVIFVLVGVAAYRRRADTGANAADRARRDRGDGRRPRLLRGRHAAERSRDVHRDRGDHRAGRGARLRSGSGAAARAGGRSRCHGGLGGRRPACAADGTRKRAPALPRRPRRGAQRDRRDRRRGRAAPRPDRPRLRARGRTLQRLPDLALPDARPRRGRDDRADEAAVGDAAARPDRSGPSPRRGGGAGGDRSRGRDRPARGDPGDGQPLRAAGERARLHDADDRDRADPASGAARRRGRRRARHRRRRAAAARARAALARGADALPRRLRRRLADRPGRQVRGHRSRPAGDDRRPRRLHPRRRADDGGARADRGPDDLRLEPARLGRARSSA